MRYLGATAVGSTEAPAAGAPNRMGRRLGVPPHTGNGFEPHDTLEFPHVGTRFLAAEVCLTTT